MNTNKTSISFTAEELEMICRALNDLNCHYADKSDTLKRITEKAEGWQNDLGNPDFFQRKWEECGSIWSKCYRAEQRLINR